MMTENTAMICRHTFKIKASIRISTIQRNIYNLHMFKKGPQIIQAIIELAKFNGKADLSGMLKQLYCVDN